MILSQAVRFSRIFRLTTLGIIGLLVTGIAAGCIRPAQIGSTMASTIHLVTEIELPNEVATGQIAVVPGHYAYVLNWSGPIAVVDGTQLVKLLSTPGEMQEGFGSITSHPHTGQVYVADQLDDQVHVIQGTEVISTLVDVGKGPLSIAIHPRTDYVYVASSLYVEGQPGSGLTIISDTQVITRMRIGVSANVVAPDPTDQQVYIGQDLIPEVEYQPQSTVVVIEATSLLTRTSLNYESNRGGVKNIEVHPRTGEVYLIENMGTVAYWHGDVVKRQQLGSMGYTGLHDIAIDPTRDLAYVSSWGDPQSHVVILKEGEIVDALPVGTDPREIIYDATHDYIFVANRLANSVSVIRGTQILATVSTQGWGPTYLAVDEERGYLYVSNADSHSISVFTIGGVSWWENIFISTVNR
jgi:DNA-binding beta-propeller fold protein YncE